MKIAFVAFMPKPSPGIERTLVEKARAFAALNHSTDVLVINSREDRSEGNLHYIRYRPRFYPYTVFQRYRLIEQAAELKQYEVVILRYPSADPSGPGFTQRIPTITEHHTRPLAEMAAYRRHKTPVAERWMKRIRQRLEERHGPATLHEVRGVIGVTDEITRSEVERQGGTAPSLTVANGVEVESVPVSGFVPFDGSNLNIVFVGGLDAPWYGLDRLLKGIASYQGPVDVRLHIVGGVKPHSHAGPPGTTFHGFLSGEKLEALMRSAHLAVTSLALHRMGMAEACTLKTREYTARGLPFVLGHRDPDLDAAAGQNPFFLPVPADDSPINMETLLGFAGECAFRSGHLANEMRTYAAEHMDWQPKLSRYLDFCQNILP